MLTSLRLQNFKSWADTGLIRLAPLTVIFGGNSAGKSSLGHLLLTLKQTALSADRKRALNLGDASTLIDLGTFADCLHGHDLSRKLSFELAWRLAKPIEVVDALQPKLRFSGNRLRFEATIAADPKSGQPRTEGFNYHLSNDDREVLAVDVSPAGSDFAVTAEPLKLMQVRGRPPSKQELEKFYRLPETGLARYQNAGFLTDFALETERVLRGIAYLGPLRDAPKRMYQWSGDNPEDVGQKGEFAIAALLSAEQDGRTLGLRGKKSLQRFSEVVAGQLQTLGVIEKFTIKPISEGRKDYEALVRTSARGAEVKLTDVGVGVSQVLPALVQAFYCAPNATVWMEQPEIHLHPQVQAELADVFIAAVQAREGRKPRNVQLIIESHSEHFLNRLQRRIAEEAVTPEEVAIYFATRQGDSARLEPLRLNTFGEIENWPADFFGDDMADLTARTVAAARRRGGART